MNGKLRYTLNKTSRIFHGLLSNSRINNYLPTYDSATALASPA